MDRSSNMGPRQIEAHYGTTKGGGREEGREGGGGEWGEGGGRRDWGEESGGTAFASLLPVIDLLVTGAMEVVVCSNAWQS